MYKSSLTRHSYTNPIAWKKLPKHFHLSVIYTVCIAFDLAILFKLKISQVWIFIELIFVYFFYVETRGPTLEELAKIFDGENAEVAHLNIDEVEKEVHVDSTNDKRAAKTSEAAV